MKKILPVIGLFGTCGNSTWRQYFIQRYIYEGINFYNPQVADGEWSEEMATEEAEHLVNDDILLFPVTSETYGLGSLSETGFSILSALRSLEHRSVIVLIDPLPDEGLKENADLYKESVRARALVLAHIKKLRAPNVYLVSNMTDMLACSLKLYRAHQNLYAAKHWSVGC